MATKALTTTIAKKKMLLARAGQQDLPAITQMAFGSGGIDEDTGNVLEPVNDQQELKEEIYRKNIDKVEIVSDTQVRYYCTLEENELSGEDISEIALVDADGDLVTIKNFMAKGKDVDFQMIFKINDTM